MQFSNFGTLEHHGFARNKLWTLDPNPPPFPTNSNSRAFVDLVLKNSEDDTKNWPHRYFIYIYIDNLTLSFW